MGPIGLRELRQHAGVLVRRAEEGEEFLVTAAGRPAAVLGPVTPRQWRRYTEIEAIFSSRGDAERAADRDRIDQAVGRSWPR